MEHQCPFVLTGKFADLGIALGTSSDRYGGWRGQIYHRDYKVTKRPKKLAKGTFTEEVMPVESVQEFFEHLDFVEIDFTFYNYLLDEKGKTTPTYKTLESYGRNLPPDARVTLKVPQLLTAHRLYRGGKAVDNPDRHNPGAFSERFHGPALELLGDKVSGFIFEHEYKRKAERPEPGAYVEDQRKFFDALPKDGRYHVEERTESLKTEEYWSWLREASIGNVLSHWTYLPTLSEQFERQGKTASSKVQILRLLTPLGVRYEDAYAEFHPFDSLKDPPEAMIRDTVRIAEVLSESGVKVLVTANNRSGGNSPEILRLIAEGLSQS